jgi:hypothetical protein
MRSWVISAAVGLGLLFWADSAVEAQRPPSRAAGVSRSAAPDTAAPVITHDAPASHAGAPLLSITVAMTDDVELAYYAVNDAQVAANSRLTIVPPGQASASFQLQRPLLLGPNTVLLLAVDAAGNAARAVLSIEYSPGGGGGGGVTPPAGGVLITEIMANPTTLPDAQGEWFEVQNPGATPYDLIGCVISRSGGASHTIGSRPRDPGRVCDPGQRRGAGVRADVRL